MKCEDAKKKQKVELFNLKNKEGQQKFKELTSKPGILSDILKDNKDDIETVTNRFIKKLNKCLHKCFKKIRVHEKENKDLTKLFDERRT